MEAGADIFLSLSLLFLFVSIAGLIFHRLGLPTVLAYVLTGVTLGPSGLNLIKESDVILQLANIGIIALMFTCGMEFSFSQLRRLKRQISLGGVVYGSLIMIPVVLMSLAARFPVSQSVIFAFVLFLSSTALVIKYLEDTQQVHAPQGQLSIGICILQDILIIPFMIIFPAVFLSSGHLGLSVTSAIGKATAFITVSWLLARFVAPFFLDILSASRSRELFTIGSIGFCISIAFFGHALGLSLPLSAFIAGLVISETMYRHKIMADLTPFKDIFLGIFFVSVGMLLSLKFLWSHWLVILGLTVMVVSLKGLAGFAAGYACRFPIRAGTISALAMAQVGEFSFVLMQWARGHNIVTDEQFQAFISCTVLSIIVAPLLWKYSKNAGRYFESLKWLSYSSKTQLSVPSSTKRWPELKNHVIVCGCGIIGRSITDHLRDRGIPVIVIELNPITVKQLQNEGIPALFADAAQPETLTLARIDIARAMVITLPEHSLVLAIISNAQLSNPGLYILARAKFVTQTQALSDLGVAVVHEEQEVAYEMLREFLVFQGEDPRAAFDIIREKRTGN
ncbi:MAG: cation:proton antiporter [Verrucomicrobiota bacterium]|nr:cation:proton antiporter [Verrucomicrobiota bacterium]